MMRKFLCMLLLVGFVSTFFSVPVCAGEVGNTEEMAQVDVPVFVTFAAPQIEVALPGDATFEQLEFAGSMADSWKEDASFGADFSEVIETAEHTLVPVTIKKA